jgi:hypothetical protein
MFEAFLRQGVEGRVMPAAAVPTAAAEALA